MYLYHFNMITAAAGALGTPYSAILTLNANGSTTAQATTRSLRAYSSSGQGCSVWWV